MPATLDIDLVSHRVRGCRSPWQGRAGCLLAVLTDDEVVAFLKIVTVIDGEFDSRPVTPWGPKA